MTIACMQPYLFPYIGYWQLIAAVDRFVILDDVNFISRGWINRNRILVGEKPHWLTIPLHKASQNKEIREIFLAEDLGWLGKWQKTLEMSYARAPFYEQGTAMFEECVGRCDGALVNVLEHGIRLGCKYFGLDTEILRASDRHPKMGRGGAERIRLICEAEGADRYVNLSGGRELYEASFFEDKGIDLRFIETQWNQLTLDGLPEFFDLSILHLSMENSYASLRSNVGKYSLEKPD